MLTERDTHVLRTIADYFALSRMQVQRLCFPLDANGRITRRRLQTLIDAKFIQRHPVPVPVHGVGSPCPVYFPARRGCEFLADFLGDDRYRGLSAQTPQPHLLLHWLAISETHIALNASLPHAPGVTLDGWINEWATLNPLSNNPHERYQLYTVLDESPRLVCAPDAAFCLAVRGVSKAFYLEQDRNTSGVRQIATSKTKGYAVLAERMLHRRHFPHATLDDFVVLMVMPSAHRRDAVRKAMIELKVPGASLWRFATMHDLTPTQFLTAPVWYPVEGEPKAVIRAETLTPSTSTEPN